MICYALEDPTQVPGTTSRRLYRSHSHNIGYRSHRSGIYLSALKSLGHKMGIDYLSEVWKRVKTKGTTTIFGYTNLHVPVCLGRWGTMLLKGHASDVPRK